MENGGKFSLKMTISVFTLILVVFFYSTASAQNDKLSLIEQLEEQVQILLNHIENLKARISTLKSELKTPAPASETATGTQRFARNFGFGSSGEDVKQLQEFLAKDKNLYPEGLITGFFGPLTEAAVKKLQIQHEIISGGTPDTTGYGYIGPKTLTRLNELVTEGAGSSGIVPPGITTAPGIQEGLTTTTPAAATTTSSTATTTAQTTCAKDFKYCSTKDACTSAGFYWYTLSCHNTPAPSYSCAASNNNCINPTECSANGWYWCKNACYSTTSACSGQTYISSPATPTTSSAQTTSSASSATTTTTSASASTPTTTTTATSTTTAAVAVTTTGICQVRNSFTSVVSFSAPDLGTGYAKVAKSGINTIEGLRSACSQSDYDALLTSYCTSNSEPVQQEVVTYDSQGNWSSTGGGPFGSNQVSCPSQTTTQTLAPLATNFTGAASAASNSSSCTDTDNGTDFGAKGTITGWYPLTNNLNATLTDYCWNNNVAIVLQEYYCYNNSPNNNYITQGTYNCPNGYSCSDGACRSATAFNIPGSNLFAAPFIQLWNSFVR